MSEQETLAILAGNRSFDTATIRRWRSEAITAPAHDRVWLNRCEALCNALLDARARAEVSQEPKT